MPSLMHKCIDTIIFIVSCSALELERIVYYNHLVFSLITNKLLNNVFTNYLIFRKSMHFKNEHLLEQALMCWLS
jgi:hypothetical protein